MVVCACQPSYTGSVNWRLEVQGSPGINASLLKERKKERKRENERKEGRKEKKEERKERKKEIEQ
jgi:hypothetical protein